MPTCISIRESTNKLNVFSSDRFWLPSLLLLHSLVLSTPSKTKESNSRVSQIIFIFTKIGNERESLIDFLPFISHSSHKFLLLIVIKNVTAVRIHFFATNLLCLEKNALNL